ncbi:gluconokinase, GntK/IdnK-type [Roseisolibacter sp. H3M3-2]|uniref:gluconokinase n=1 Tax=Roseisolibacter sp. H3M3-2 TaxID=3031323 RepID=UPI0023DCD97C|nr:gluconokinase, GntK/IdnK-type [Roseisolibacter sp. H3M3-2]MDF1505237.1 gluconokinase, GntK/IdnK-type [Roseisolibacter sp. H3M3-2]
MERPPAPGRVAVVMGPAGAGKTTVGAALARALGWAFHDADDFHSDDARARMRAGVALTDAERAARLARLDALVARMVDGGGSAVLACSALRRAYRAALLADTAHPDRVLVAFLDAPRDVLAARLASRAGHFFPPALLDSQLATLERPGPAEPATTLVVDAARPADAIVAELAAALRA